MNVQPMQQLTDKQLLDKLRYEMQDEHEPSLLRSREMLIAEAEQAKKDAARQLADLAKRKAKAAAAAQVAQAAADEAQGAYIVIHQEAQRVEHLRDAAAFKAFRGLNASADPRLHDAVTVLRSLASRSELFVSTQSIIRDRHAWPQQVVQVEANRPSVASLRAIVDRARARLESLILLPLRRADISAELAAVQSEINTALVPFQTEPVKFVTDEEQ